MLVTDGFSVEIGADLGVKPSPSIFAAGLAG
jgi:hypothetical protein